jgi:hypothetical protein
MGFVPKDVYQRAEKLYETVRQGGVKVSADYDNEAAAVAESEY